MARKKEYDWIDDPFKEDAKQQEAPKMSTGSKAFIGCGCLIAVAVIVILFILIFSGLAGALA